MIQVAGDVEAHVHMPCSAVRQETIRGVGCLTASTTQGKGLDGDAINTATRAPEIQGDCRIIPGQHDVVDAVEFGCCYHLGVQRTARDDAGGSALGTNGSVGWQGLAKQE